jgi:hypothetical protein
MAILLGACRFPDMGASFNCSLQYELYARMQDFVLPSTSPPFLHFVGDVGRWE